VHGFEDSESFEIAQGAQQKHAANAPGSDTKQGREMAGGEKVRLSADNDRTHEQQKRHYVSGEGSGVDDAASGNGRYSNRSAPVSAHRPIDMKSGEQQEQRGK